MRLYLKLVIPLLIILAAFSACQKKKAVPVDAPPISEPVSGSNGIYSGFFVIEQQFNYDTLNNLISNPHYRPWVRVFNEPQNDYAITKGVNNGVVKVDYQSIPFYNGTNAYIGNVRPNFDSAGYRFSLSNSINLPSFQYNCTDTFYVVPSFLFGFIPPQISVNQPFTIPLPSTAGVDEILVFVKKQDGTPLSAIKRFPAGTTQLTLNPNDFANVTSGLHDIEVVIKRFFVKNIGGKTFRFELHTVTDLTKRFV